MNRVEAVGLPLSNYTFKIATFVSMRNGAISWNIDIWSTALLKFEFKNPLHVIMWNV